MKSKKNVLLTLLAAAPVILLLCLLLGPAGIGLPQIHTPAGKAIFMLRVNRVLQGFFVGAALSCAGVVFQAILRNPLAEPYILGVSSGAGLGAALCILAGLTTVHFLALPLSAFAAAAITLVIVFTLARRGGQNPSVYGLILSGVIVSSICSSILMFLVATASSDGLHSVVWWMLGNLQAAETELLAVTSLIIITGICALWAISRELNALTLGSETAYHAGIQTGTSIIFSLAVATIITAAAVSISGLIGFVGLIVPHVMRTLTGPDHRRLIPASAIAGGVFLALCDAFARTIMQYEIPVGVITAILGGPFFLAILGRRKKYGWIE